MEKYLTSPSGLNTPKQEGLSHRPNSPKPVGKPIQGLDYGFSGLVNPKKYKPSEIEDLSDQLSEGSKNSSARRKSRREREEQYRREAKELERKARQEREAPRQSDFVRPDPDGNYRHTERQREPSEYSQGYQRKYRQGREERLEQEATHRTVTDTPRRSALDKRMPMEASKHGHSAKGNPRGFLSSFLGGSASDSEEPPRPNQVEIPLHPGAPDEGRSTRVQQNINKIVISDSESRGGGHYQDDRRREDDYRDDRRREDDYRDDRRREDDYRDDRRREDDRHHVEEDRYREEDRHHEEDHRPSGLRIDPEEILDRLPSHGGGDDLYLDEEEKPQLTHREKVLKKRKLMLRSGRLEKKGYPPATALHMTMDLDEMQEVVDLQIEERALDNSIEMQRDLLTGFCSGTEALNKKFDPCDLQLNGWSESVYENIERYDEVFEELYYKYNEKVSIEPEVKLIGMVAGSALSYHFSKSIFDNAKDTVPGFESVMAHRPDLAEQYREAALGMMGNQGGGPPRRPPPPHGYGGAGGYPPGYPQGPPPQHTGASSGYPTASPPGHHQPPPVPQRNMPAPPPDRPVRSPQQPPPPPGTGAGMPAQRTGAGMPAQRGMPAQQMGGGAGGPDGMGNLLGNLTGNPWLGNLLNRFMSPGSDLDQGGDAEPGRPNTFTHRKNERLQKLKERQQAQRRQNPGKAKYPKVFKGLNSRNRKTGPTIQEINSVQGLDDGDLSDIEDHDGLLDGVKQPPQQQYQQQTPSMPQVPPMPQMPEMSQSRNQSQNQNQALQLRTGMDAGEQNPIAQFRRTRKDRTIAV